MMESNANLWIDSRGSTGRIPGTFYVYDRIRVILVYRGIDKRREARGPTSSTLP